MKQSWTPIWKKIEITFDEKKEELSKGGIALLARVDKANPYVIATVVGFDPLAGTDSRSGQRYHDFTIGEKIVVNRQHVQTVMIDGEVHNFINDIFVVASGGLPQEHKIDLQEMAESDLPSTIAELEDISFRQMASIGKDS